MEIRNATTADAAVLARFGARAFRAAFLAGNDPEDVERYVAAAFSDRRVAEELADPRARFLLAAEPSAPQATMVGYAHLRGPVSAAGVDGQCPVELVRLYVDPDLTGRGYGSPLLEASLAAAREAGGDVLWLGVWEHNSGARRFYARHGFRRVGEQEFLLGTDRQTDHVLARRLPAD